MFKRLLTHPLAGKLLGPGLWALVIKVASAGLSYFMLVAFARMLDPVGYGEFGMMLNVAIVISAVAAIGLPTGVMRFWPGHIAQNQPELALGFHRGAQRLLLIIALALAGFGILASVTGLFQNALGGPWRAFWVAALAGLFAFGDYYANALRSQGRVLWSMVPRDVFWRVFATVLLGFWFLNQQVVSAQSAVIVCVATMAVVVAAQAVVSRQTAAALIGRMSATSDWPTWRKPLVPLAAASVLYAMVQQLDVVVVGALVGPQEAGAYFAAQKTASLLGLVMIAGGLVAAPLMSAAFQARQTGELQRLCKLLSLAIAVTTLAGFVVILIIGKPLLAIFDPAYQSAYAILIILSVGYAVDALAGPTAYLMQMTSLESAYLRIMAVVYALVLALQIAVVPHYGAIGAAASTAFGVCLWNIIAVYQLRKSIGVDSSILSFFMRPSQA